jgi:hypothetical protein
MEQDESLRPPEFLEPIEAVRDRIARAIGELSIPKKIRAYHPAIEGMLANDDERRRYAQATRNPHTQFTAAAFETPFELRRLRILNALLIALTGINGVVSQIDVVGSNYGLGYHREISVELLLSGRKVSFVLERSRRHEAVREAAELPEESDAAKLRLAIGTYWRSKGHPGIWEDSNKTSLEQRLTEIAIEFVLAVEIMRRQEAIWAYDRAVADSQRRKQIQGRQEKERAEQAERLRTEQLLRDAAAFRQAAEIREYVNAVRQTSAPKIEPWCQWALEQANRLDPIVSGEFLKAIT